MNKPLVMKNVYKGYGEDESRIEILKDVDLSIEQGEFVMMLGPSGTGKSTILHLVAGLTPVDKGLIQVCGTDVARCNNPQILKLRRENIGFVFQDFRLLQGLTALENVMVPFFSIGNSKEYAIKESTRLLTLLGLEHRLHHYPRKMSGGEQQRVGIARALANQPRIILADEPTGNLDQKLANSVVEILASLPKKINTSILMVTHNAELTKYATRVVRLNDGHLEVSAND